MDNGGTLATWIRSVVTGLGDHVCNEISHSETRVNATSNTYLLPCAQSEKFLIDNRWKAMGNQHIDNRRRDLCNQNPANSILPTDILSTTRKHDIDENSGK